MGVEHTSTPAYDGQESGETQPLTLRAGVLEGIAVGVNTNAAVAGTANTTQAGVEFTITEERPVSLLLMLRKPAPAEVDPYYVDRLRRRRRGFPVGRLLLIGPWVGVSPGTFLGISA